MIRLGCGHKACCTLVLGFLISSDVYDAHPWASAVQSVQMLSCLKMQNQGLRIFLQWGGVS